VRRSRAGITKETVIAYTLSLNKSLKDVSPQSVINYVDNLSDDFNYNKITARHGIKCLEHVMNNPKLLTSIICAGMEDGVLLRIMYFTRHHTPKKAGQV
jgi:hypothetical protein